MSQLLTATSTDKEKQLIDEQLTHAKFELVEGQGDRSGRLFARGEFAHAAKPTANKRLYKHNVWEKNIERLSESLKQRRVLGELDHPTDGRTALQRASHVLTDIRLEGDRVIGETEILNTSRGRDLRAIMEAGVPVGVSSRGFGGTVDEGGIAVVEDDFKLVTFDFVAEPADDTAYPEPYFEGVGYPDVASAPQEAVAEDAPPEASEPTAEPEAATENDPPDRSEATVEELRSEFETVLIARLESMREEVARQIREELETDPEVAGARTALQQVGVVIQPYLLPESARAYVAEREEEIRRLQERLEAAEAEIARQVEVIQKLAAAAKQAGYRYHLESLISGDPQADLIRELVGDVLQFNSAEELEARVEAARDQAKKQQYQEARTRQAEKQAKEEKQALAEDLERTKAANKKLELRLYAQQRLQTHPKGANILRVLEQSGYNSKAAIDALIESYREPEPGPDELEAARGRARRMLSGGREHRQREVTESRPSEGAEGSYNDLGITVQQFKHLSGLPRS